MAAFLFMFLLAFKAPQVDSVSHWVTSPSILICNKDVEYLEKSISFWQTYNFEFDRVMESWYCPDFLDGFIIISIDKTMKPNTLGRTVLSINDDGTMSKAHIYVRQMTFEKREQITLAHELGHALGFLHTKSNLPRHIMNPSPLRQKWEFKKINVSL